jgi:hypothetical protein
MSQESIKYASYLTNWNYKDAWKSLEDLKKLIIDNLKHYDHLSIKYTNFYEAVKNEETGIIEDLQFKFAGEDKEKNWKIYMVLAKLLHIDEIQVIGMTDGLFPWAKYIQEDLISNFSLDKVDLINMIRWIKDFDEEISDMLEKKWLAKHNYQLSQYFWDKNKLRSMTNEELLELYKKIR